MRVLSRDFCSGLLGVDAIAGIELDDVFEIEEENGWIVPITITIQTESEHVPFVTSWFARVSYGYPRGAIDVFPSITNSITTTFPHQNANVAYENRFWREGRLCLDVNGRHLFGERAMQQPTTAQERLAWHLERARTWLIAAANGTLQRPGDPFEFPGIATRVDVTIVYAEDEETYASWVAESVKPSHVGSCEIAELNPRTLVARRFKRKTSPKSPWGTLITSRPTFNAAWIMLPKIPIVGAFALPTTWGELRSCLRPVGVDLNEILRRVAQELRQVEWRLLLIGFPIPRSIGEADVEVAFLAARIPNLRRDKRLKEKTLWTIDLSTSFRNEEPIHWVQTLNVADSHMRTRGILPTPLLQSRVLLIGVGSLGSGIAEVLIRKGLRYLTVVDGEAFAAGNIRRHMLTLLEIGANKASMLASRLNSLSFFAHVHAVNQAVEEIAQISDVLDAFDIVIDCTAEDDVISFLATLAGCGHKKFYSFSMQAEARALLAFMSQGTSFDEKAFLINVNRVDQELADDDVTIRDVGCQNPAFPAQWNKILRLTASAVDFIQSTHATGEPLVFERLVAD